MENFSFFDLQKLENLVVRFSGKAFLGEKGGGGIMAIYLKGIDLPSTNIENKLPRSSM